MILHVHRLALRSGAAEVIVATDDARIRDACRAAGAAVEMTAARHASGTDRIAEVAVRRGWAGDDIVVNVQGDEPLLPPALIGQVARLLAATPGRGDRDAGDADLERSRLPRPERRQGRRAAGRDGALLQPRAHALGPRRRGADARSRRPAPRQPAAPRPLRLSRRGAPRARDRGARRARAARTARTAARARHGPRHRRRGCAWSCRARASTRRRTSRARRRSADSRAPMNHAAGRVAPVLRGRDQPHCECARAAGPARHPHGSRPAVGRRAGSGDRCRAPRACRVPAGLLGERGARRAARRSTTATSYGLALGYCAHRAHHGRVRGARARDVGAVQPRRARRRAAAGLPGAPQRAARARPRAGRVRLRRRHALPADSRDGGRARPGAGRR